MVLVIKTIYMIQEFQEVCKNLNREQVGKVSLFCCFFKFAFSRDCLFKVTCWHDPPPPSLLCWKIIITFLYISSSRSHVTIQYPSIMCVSWIYILFK
jgi:hypothetical protein